VSAAIVEVVPDDARRIVGRERRVEFPRLAPFTKFWAPTRYSAARADLQRHRCSRYTRRVTKVGHLARTFRLILRGRRARPSWAYVCRVLHSPEIIPAGP
jgi:hypothetical protein